MNGYYSHSKIFLKNVWIYLFDTTFEGRCFELIGIFDKDTEKIGKTVGELKIQDIDELKSFCDNKRVSTAILCVPKSAVEPIAETLYGAGVRSFWNFSHYDLNMKYGNIPKILLILFQCLHSWNNFLIIMEYTLSAVMLLISQIYSFFRILILNHFPLN